MGDEPHADDLVELGGREFRLPGWLQSRLPGWRPSRGAAILAGAALIVGLGAGYAAGDQHARGSAASPSSKVAGSTVTASPSASGAPAPGAAFSFANSPALTQDTAACSVQTGQQLQLGVQVTNQSATTVTLLSAKAVLPIGGLRQITWQWGTCGAILDGLDQADYIPTLTPGQSAWLTVTFQVQMHCPGPAPVQFSVDYTVRGHSASASLPGFADLSQVPYRGCPAGTTGDSPMNSEINWPANRNLSSRPSSSASAGPR
jgi:hypothetical protein